MLIDKKRAGPNGVLARWRWLLLASAAGPVPSRGLSGTPLPAIQARLCPSRLMSAAGFR